MKSSESFAGFVICLGLAITFFFQADTFRMLMVFFGNNGAPAKAWFNGFFWIASTAAMLAALLGAWLMWKRGPGR